MAIDTLMSFVVTCDSVEDAEADYQLVKTLHTEAGDRPGRGAGRHGQPDDTGSRHGQPDDG